MLGERFPGRSVATEDEFLGEQLAQLAKSVRAAVSGERRTARQVTVQLAGIDRNVERAHSRQAAGAGVVECRANGRLQLSIRGAHEEQADSPPTEAILEEEWQALLDHLVGRILDPPGICLPLSNCVQLALERGGLTAQLVLLGVVDFPAQAHTHEDPDQQRDEDGRERGDVIAEVEHSVEPRGSLAEGMQPRERFLRGETEPLDRDAPPRCLDGHARSRLAVVAFEVDRSGEPLLHVVPGDAAILLDRRDRYQPLLAGTAKQPSLVADDLPPRPGLEPTAIRANDSVTRPPVGEVARLREQRPDVARRRQQLPFGLHSHPGDCHDSGTKASPTRADFLVTLAVGRRLGVPGTSGSRRGQACSGQAEDLEHPRAEQVDRLAQFRGDQHCDD
jgi:hypothetical protein